MSDELETIEGRFVFVTFHNESNQYTVAKFRLRKNERKQLTVTGYFPEPDTANTYRLTGTYVVHPRYGQQFQAGSCEVIRPDDAEGMVLYLSGSRFPGIGARTAARLVKDFGVEIFEKIEKDPSVLDSADYLSAAKKEALIAGAKESSDDSEKIFRFFSSHHLSMKNIVQIQKVYENKAVEMVSADPYRLVYEVPGIGFETADQFALSLGVEASDPARIRAYALTLLKNGIMNSGSSYLPFEEFSRIVRAKTAGAEYDLEEIMDSLERMGMVHIEQDRIYTQEQYEAENLVASYLAHFPARRNQPVDPDELSRHIERLEQTYKIHYDDQQVEAIEQFFTQDIMILTGGPGTGKTTIVKAVIQLIRILYPEATLSLAAPTGRAAKRLKELTDFDAKTIHSLLGYDMDSLTFTYDHDNPLLSQILIVDEFSMVDIYLLSHLLDAGVYFQKILFIGDEDQLPSVGPGQVLKDLLECGHITTVRLHKIFRQAEGSGIIQLAHQIADDTFEEFPENNVTFLPRDLYDSRQEVCKQFLTALDLGYNMTDVQVLAPKYNGAIGIDELNRALQEVANPPSPKKRQVRVGSRIFRIGDKILQTKNQPDDNVFNGDIGILTEIEEPRENDAHEYRLEVDYQGIRVQYSREDFDNITHAFCVSVHKAQGSEYPVVIMPLDFEQGIMLQKRLIYTAVTRAEVSLILIGDAGAFKQGIRAKERSRRKTTLQLRIEEAVHPAYE